MATSVLINGEASTELAVQDRGLHYGDGAFETIAVQDGKPLCLDAHLQRLIHCCDRLGIPLNADPELFSEEADALIRDLDRAVLKIIVTRGPGGRGYAPPAEVNATRILATYPWPEFPIQTTEEGIATRICETRYGHNPQLAGMKHLNRLEQVMARAEWNNPEIAEGIVLDVAGNVIEGTMSNLFYIANEQIYTPDLSNCGINGIVRQKLIELEGKVHVVTTRLDELLNAEEVFICNSIIGLWPVTRIDVHQFEVGKKSLALKQTLIEQGIICH